MCVKSKCGPEGSREHNISHANATKVLSHNFGDTKHLVPKDSEGGSNSTKYTNIQSEYVGSLDKIKLLEACIMAYGMRDPFIIPTLVDDYAGTVEDCWGGRAIIGVYLLSH